MSLIRTASRERRPIIERLMEKIIVVPNGCWIWTGSRNNKGYALIFKEARENGSKRCVLAHRVCYEHNVGPVPEGLELDHKCRETGCVNWRHVEPVTHQENGARRPKRTACDACGGEITQLYPPRPHRGCAPCMRQKRIENWASKKRAAENRA